MKTNYQFLRMKNLLLKHDPGSIVLPSAAGSLAWARAC
jgi:hypothetical protein